jgi:hypothetical protein
VVLLERLGIVLLIAAAFPSQEARRLTKLVFWPVLAILAILNAAYLILDFLVSTYAIDNWKENWEWRLTDRDTGLVNTPHSIQTLLMNGDNTLSPFYVERRMYDVLDEQGWQTRRDTQVQIGVAADFLALALAVFLAVVALVPRVLRRKSAESGRGGTVSELSRDEVALRSADICSQAFLLLAALGLFTTTLFRVIISTHYVLHNWNAVGDPSLWVQWLDEYTMDEIGLAETGPGTFLPGYRTVVSGFWIVHAVFGPLGVVLAVLGMVLWWRGRVKCALPPAGPPPYGG